jgi:transcriptional regulator with XRE-family HTH domain
MRRRMKEPPAVASGDPFYWNHVVGVNVRRVRTARGLSQAQLAERMARAGDPLSAVAISNLEMHTMNPDGADRVSPRTAVRVDRLMTLARVLGTTYLDLLREDTLFDAGRTR